MIIGQLLDGIIGAVIGATVTGAAQIWSFHRGKRSARADQSVSAAADLLGTLYAATDMLRLLPVHGSPGRLTTVIRRARRPGPSRV